MSERYTLVPAGDSAVVVQFEERIDAAINARAIALAEALARSRVPGVRDIVPTFCAVTVYFDPLRTDTGALAHRVAGTGLEFGLVGTGLELEPGGTGLAGGLAGTGLEAVSAGTGLGLRPGLETALRGTEAEHRIPVCYGGEFGPDLGAVAAFGRMTEEDVISVHTGALYRVFMLGFVPGFAYMGLVDERIAAPRLASPRSRVPAGSVAIAGQQTGVYPMDTPGGWRIIGRTSVRPLDMGTSRPFLFKAGDLVRFYPIDRQDYDGSVPNAV